MASLSCRWFRFSLRTLFVVVMGFAAGAGWIAAEMRHIAARKEFLRQNIADGGDVLKAADIESVIDYEREREIEPSFPSPATIPIWRTWLGDEGIAAIGWPEHLQGCFGPPHPELQDYIDRRDRLFPEAADFNLRRLAADFNLRRLAAQHAKMSRSSK